MKRFLIFNILFFFSIAIISCRHNAVHELSDEERGKVDSIVYSNRNIDSLSRLYDTFREDGNLYGEVVVCRELGRAYRNASNYKEAIEIHTTGLEIAREICDTLNIIQALNNIGTVYRRMGSLEEAASWHYRGLLMCDLWSEVESPVGLKNRVVSLNGLGNVQFSLGKDSLAMLSFREALIGENHLGSYTGMAINYANIGAIFEKAGNTDSAAVYYRRSLESNIKAGSNLGIALCHNHFGRLAEREGDYDKAYSEYKIAYDILSESSDRWHWLESGISISRVLVKKDDYNRANTYLSKSLGVAKELSSDTHLADIYSLYYEINKDAGRYGEALKWMEQYVKYVRRIYEEKSKDAIYEIRAEYEREKSMAQISIMQQEHTASINREKQIVVSEMIFLVLAILVIVFLVYSLRLRSHNNRILKELDQTKNNYFTNLTHEFRTPLTIILSAANSLKRNAENEIDKTNASDIITQSQSLLNLVNQILGVAKMTSAIAPDPICRHGNLSAFIYDIYERNIRLSHDYGVNLKCKMDDNLEIDFVPDYITYVVQNLLSNAIKYSGRGSVVYLYLEKIVSDRGGECVRIRVKDNGKGISEEEMKHIFDPFYQAESSNIETGIGIGLSLVKLSVEAMRGSVTVKSNPGECTEFTVEIPAVHKTIEENGIISDIDIDADSDSDEFCILIVEDNYDVAKWQMRQLEGNYRIVYAKNGQDGLRKAEENIPDLIITDVMMPVMDGIEMCKFVRKSDLLYHIPVIMVTAKATFEDRMKGLEAGADVYLEKPYNQSELVLRINALLKKRETLRMYFANSSICGQDGHKEDTAVKISAVDSAFLEKFEAALSSAFETGKVDCEHIAASLCIGRVQLNRKMKAITGLKTTEYILQARMAKAKQLLSSTSFTIGEIALRCGVDDIGYFSTIFKKYTGVTPSAYRNKCME